MTEHIISMDIEDGMTFVINAVSNGFTYQSQNYGKSGILKKDEYKILIEEKDIGRTLLHSDADINKLVRMVKN